MKHKLLKVREGESKCMSGRSAIECLFWHCVYSNHGWCSARECDVSRAVAEGSEQCLGEYLPLKTPREKSVSRQGIERQEELQENLKDTTMGVKQETKPRNTQLRVRTQEGIMYKFKPRSSHRYRVEA